MAISLESARVFLGVMGGGLGSGALHRASSAANVPSVHVHVGSTPLSASVDVEIHSKSLCSTGPSAFSSKDDVRSSCSLAVYLVTLFRAFLSSRAMACTHAGQGPSDSRARVHSYTSRGVRYVSYSPERAM